MENFKILLPFLLQMHGYDLNGMPPLQPHQHGPHPPPPGHQMNGPPGGSMDSGITSHHHPDSTDSYVTYLESDDSMPGSP